MQMNRNKRRAARSVRGIVLRATVGCALMGFLQTESLSMTCNIARPYNPQLGGAAPVFSRVRENLLFERGDRIEFFLFGPLRPLRATWALKRNGVVLPFATGDAEPRQDQSVRVEIPERELAPGFYDVAVSIWATETNRADKTVSFGYRVDKIPLAVSRPGDFDAFWEKGKAKQAALPLNVAETFVRELDDAAISDYNVTSASIPEHVDPAGERCRAIRLFKVQFDAPGGKRIHGWLTVPQGKGPFPAMLVLPGAGCGAIPAPVEHARHGYVSLMIQIHGMEVDQATYKTPAGYLKQTDGPPEEAYYYNVYLACAQAVRYLASRPDVDAKRIMTVGASQGGHLAIVTAALCPEVAAVVSGISYYGYWPLRDQVAALNRAKQDGRDAPVPPPFDRNDPRQHALSYYDTANFAPLVKGATLMGVCLSDTPSPAPTVQAVFRRLGASRKELVWSAGTNHDFIIPFERQAWEWVDRVSGYARKDTSTKGR